MHNTSTREVLELGEVSINGRMPWSSNSTFLVTIKHEDVELRAVYKPEKGEQPLRDFEPGLYKREIAAFELSQALQWDLVPLTIQREDLPYEVGSLQLFIEADFEQHYFTLLEQTELHDQLVKIALFDILANNADRKAGHVICRNNNELFAIDNGLCFHQETKLRTVIWDFANTEIPGALLDDIKNLQLPPSLEHLLQNNEIEALTDRIGDLLETPILPAVNSPYQLPWPLI